MIDLELASLITRVLIGAGQIGIVWYGIAAMKRANEQRALAGERQARSQSDLVERQERQAERRHAETMASLDLQRQASERQGQALDRQGQALEKQGQALEKQGQALAALVKSMNTQNQAFETLIARAGGGRTP